MRNLQIYSGNLYGGVEKTLTMIAEAPGAIEREFALCFEGRLRGDLIRAGARVHDLGRVRSRWPWTVARARRALRTLLARTRFEIAICHSAWSQAIFGPIVRRAGLPLVFWLHDVATGRHWLERWARLTRPDLVICNSRFTARSVASLYPNVRTEIVRPPVVTGPDGRAAGRADVRRTLGAGDDVVVIVQVARLESLKGHDAHLEALALLRDSAPRWQCWMGGGLQRSHEALYLQALRRKATALGIADRVKFLGQRSDVPALLSAADIYCQPNVRPDAFGIAFVEALAAGLPVVTTAARVVGSMRGDTTPRSASVAWVMGFVLTMFACQTMIAFGPFPAIRTWLRVTVYAISLVLMIIVRGGGRRHPAVLPATLVLLILGVELFHPDTSGYLPGVVHAGLYFAILAPLFWVP